MSRRQFSFPLFLSALLCLSMSMPAPGQTTGGENVSLVDRQSYYDVTLNLEKGASHRQIGEEYGALIKSKVPRCEALLDSYIADMSRNWLVYKVLLHRVQQVKPQVPKSCQDEIEGISSRLSSTKYNRRADGKLSADELYMLNLIADVGRVYQCSALGVFGQRSAGGATIVGRNLDWVDGASNQLAQLQAVITIKNGRATTVNVGCLGFQGVVSGFNSYGVFAGVLDAACGDKYSASHKRSYTMDLREALESGRTLDEVADYMSASHRKYAFNHVIFLADAKKSAVLENNLGTINKAGVQRALRTAASPLNDSLSWDIADTIGAVNCFALRGNQDNHIDPFDRPRRKCDQPAPDKNTLRWTRMKEQLSLLAGPVSADGVKQIMSSHGGESGSMYRGDLYNSCTFQTMVFEPATLCLQAAFRLRSGETPAHPVFEKIQLDIAPASQLAASP